jgi:hypothetical protein
MKLVAAAIITGSGLISLSIGECLPRVFLFGGIFGFIAMVIGAYLFAKTWDAQTKKKSAAKPVDDGPF